MIIGGAPKASVVTGPEISVNGPEMGYDIVTLVCWFNSMNIIIYVDV